MEISNYLEMNNNENACQLLTYGLLAPNQPFILCFGTLGLEFCKSPTVFTAAPCWALPVGGARGRLWGWRREGLPLSHLPLLPQQWSFTVAAVVGSSLHLFSWHLQILPHCALSEARAPTG